MAETAKKFFMDLDDLYEKYGIHNDFTYNLDESNMLGGLVWSVFIYSIHHTISAFSTF